MKKGKVLVTGSNGLLGQAVTAIFTRESDFDLILTSVEDKSFMGFESNYYKLDITSKEQVKSAMSFSVDSFFV